MFGPKVEAVIEGRKNCLNGGYIDVCEVSMSDGILFILLRVLQRAYGVYVTVVQYFGPHLDRV
jgi:hypothetical protein